MKTIMEKPINIPRYPPEFEQIITLKNRNFVGRQFVFTAINNFLHQYDRGYFTIIGVPGIGKSAIIANYVSQNPGIVYYNVEIPGKSRVEEFLTTICAQLIEIAQNQGIKTDNFPDFTTDNSGFLSLLLQQISDRLYREQRLIITIDGCDRIDTHGQTQGANIFYLPRYLPEKVYFILARRPFLIDKSGLLIETPAQSLDLANYSEKNRADLQEYINIYLNYHHIQSDQLLIDFGNDETNFMYVKETLAATSEDISNQNLRIYYENHFEKMSLATIKKSDIALQVLNILVQEEIISGEMIAEILDKDEYEIKVILDKWREFLHLEVRGEEIYYSLYHVDFRNWLRDYGTQKL